MVRCSILGCKSDSEKKLSGLSFHSFPEDFNLRQKWIDATGRINWIARKSSRICSIHFEKNVLIKKKKQTVLYPNAVPSQNARLTRVTKAKSPVEQPVEPKNEVLESPGCHQDNSSNDNFESCGQSDIEVKLEIESSIDIEETSVNPLSTSDVPGRTPVDQLVEPKTETLELPSDHQDYTINRNFESREVPIEPKIEVESPSNPEQFRDDCRVEPRVNWTVGPKMQIVISPNLECSVNPRVETCVSNTVEEKTGSTTESDSGEDTEECLQTHDEFKIPTSSNLSRKDAIQFEKMAHKIIKLKSSLNKLRKKFRAVRESRNRFKKRSEKQSNIIRDLQNRLSMERLKNSERNDIDNSPSKNPLSTIITNERNDMTDVAPSKNSLITVGNNSNYGSKRTHNLLSKDSIKLSSERNNIGNYILLKGCLENNR